MRETQRETENEEKQKQEKEWCNYKKINCIHGGSYTYISVYVWMFNVTVSIKQFTLLQCNCPYIILAYKQLIRNA